MMGNYENLREIWNTSGNVRAFARAVRVGEGTTSDDGYRTLFGGGLFDGYADHPRIKVTRGRRTSTAAGAYQFIAGTWDETTRKWGIPDFSPENQDLGFVALLARRKALADVVEGRLERAVMKCNKEWASLPGSPYGQPVVTLARVKAEYEKWGGVYEGAAPVQPAQPAEESVMPLPAFVAAALPAVINAVPELVKIFGSGSEVSQRNEKAAGLVMGIAKEAIGAANEQELVESLAADPNAVQAVRAAVQEQWYKLTEVGGGVAGAREAAMKMQGDRAIWHNPALWISVLLLAMPFMLLADVFYVHPDKYEDAIRTQIVTGVLMVISMVGAFWLGTSFSSGKKDDALLAGVRVK